jgi:uncharacterized protein (TIGR02265 family)
MTRQVRDTVLREGGIRAWEALLASVSPACRARFREPVGYFEWVDSALALELHEAWSRARGADFMAERGEDAAREILGGAHRWMLRLASPRLLVQAFPKVYAFYYDGGKAVLDRLGENDAALSLRAWGYPSSWFRDGVGAWLRVALQATGSRAVRLDYEPPEEGNCEHRYRVSWNPG